MTTSPSPPPSLLSAGELEKIEEWCSGDRQGIDADLIDRLLADYRAQEAQLADLRAQVERQAEAQEMQTAPRDGTLIRLLCRYEPGDHCGNALEDAEEAWTIGFWQEDDGWATAGWDWCQDVFVAGNGSPIAWAPLPEVRKLQTPKLDHCPGGEITGLRRNGDRVWCGWADNVKKCRKCNYRHNYRAAQG